MREMSNTHTSEHLYEGGLSEYVRQLNERREVLHSEVIKIRGDKEIEKGNVEVELALQWSDAFSESIRCYTNIIRNKDGGTHMSGLVLPLPVLLTHMRRKRNYSKETLYPGMMSERAYSCSQRRISRSVILVSDKG